MAGSGNAMRFRRIEFALLVLGVALLGVWAGARVHSFLGYRAGIARFAANVGSAPANTPSSLIDPDLGSQVNFRLWSVKRISAYEESLLQKTDPPLAVLRIPKIDLEVPVFNNTDDLTLNRGVGRILGTAQLGGAGNLGIAGHRDGFFRGLQNIALGDVLELAEPSGTRRYVVSQIRIVTPEDTSVLDATSVPTLTLVTCFPFYFVGHAPKRYIVTATLDGAGGTDRIAQDDTISMGGNSKNKETKR